MRHAQLELVTERAGARGRRRPRAGAPSPPAPAARPVVTGATASPLVPTPPRYHRDDGDITISIVVPSTTLRPSKIDRVVRDAFVADLSATRRRRAACRE